MPTVEASDSPQTVPAIEGWFAQGPEPALLGSRCNDCSTVFFPRADGVCRNPGCWSTDLVEHRLSNRGRLWSFTDARYQPPSPYIVPGKSHEPFCIAAVELAAEAMIVMGQMVSGINVEDLEVGMPVRLVVDKLFDQVDDAGETITHTVWKWDLDPAGSATRGSEAGEAS